MNIVLLIRSLPFHLALLCLFMPTAIAEEKPNIVYILADDMGMLDTGYSGNEFYETPNIDRLASAGMTFNRAYSGGPNCMPTRACLMSGMYCPRTHMWTPGGKSKGNFKYMKFLVPNKKNNQGSSFPSSTSLKPEVTCLAEVLKPAGYATAHFGKWHLGKDKQGFDISRSAGATSYPSEGNGYRDIDNSTKITDAALSFIEDNRRQPFFLYLAHFEVHTPLVADQEVIEKYQQKLASKAWKNEYNPTYAAMVEVLDNSVGRVLQKLDELELSKNTLVVFASDNGGFGKVTPLKPFKGAKGSLYEGGIRVPTCMKWPATISAGSTCDTPITSVDWMPTFAEIAGARLPDNQPVDGVSVVPLMSGDSIAPRSLFWHFPLYLASQSVQDRVVPVAGTNHKYWRGAPSSLICRGDWKLIHFFEDDRVELYNVTEDLSETNNLAKTNAAKANELLQELNLWREQTNAPIPTEINPAFKAPSGKNPQGGGAKKNRGAKNNQLASQEELSHGMKAVRKNPKDDPDLPNVLLIGDSISAGYTPWVRGALSEKADVFRIPGNGKDSSFGLEKLDQWLKLTPHWDVIHFNWGLWDICYRHPESKTQGHRDKVNGTLTTTEDDYRANMEKLVARLKQTNAKLIWCKTTPVPENEAGRKLGDEIRYNQIAAEIMTANGVATNDLHGHALIKLPAIASKPGDVHFSPAGYQHLAEKVVHEITTALEN